MSGTEADGMRIGGLWFLAPAEALVRLRDGALLVDLRAEELVAMKRFQVPETVWIPHLQLAEHLQVLPRERLLVLADSSGVYLRAAAALLQEQGFSRVACLNGGMLAWDQGGLPVDTDPARLLAGACPCVLRSRR